MNDVQTSPSITVSIFSPWLDQFSQFLQSDYRKITRRQLSEKSIRLAVQHTRVFGMWHTATFHQDFEPSALTNYDLHLYRKWSLDQEKIKAATWNSRHWALSILCMWIESTHGFVKLMDGVEQKQSGLTSTKHRSLTDDEYHRLVHVLEQNTRRVVTAFEYQVTVRNWAAVTLMLQAGLRVEEATLCDVDDINLNERSGSVLIRSGKGDKERSVPLNLVARNALRAWLDLRPATVSTALFTGKETTRLTTRSLQRIVEELGRQIGVPDLTPHWLRYTFAKRLEASGAPIEAIRDLLGHNSIDTTRRYLRSSAEELQSAVEGVM
jgi:site-specific recombinase XerD